MSYIQQVWWYLRIATLVRILKMIVCMYAGINLSDDIIKCVMGKNDDIEGKLYNFLCSYLKVPIIKSVVISPGEEISSRVLKVDSCVYSTIG